MDKSGTKQIAANRKAYHDYFVEDKLEAGISLKGTEVKSLRAGTVSMKDCFCQVKTHFQDPVLKDGTELYIDDLCVDEACRGRGIGKALYETACRYGAQSGCSRVTLNVWCGNDALKFYEKCGMKPQKIGMEYILC